MGLFLKLNNLRCAFHRESRVVPARLERVLPTVNNIWGALLSATHMLLKKS